MKRLVAEAAQTRQFALPSPSNFRKNKGLIGRNICDARGSVYKFALQFHHWFDQFNRDEN
jgi:hypothetical protein